MNILYIGRLFSGLKKCVQDGIWQPTGVPTVYKLIEGLDQSPHELELVLTQIGLDPGCTESSNRVMTLDGIRAPVRVIRPGRIPGIRSTAANAVNEVIRLQKLLRLVRSNRPDLIYIGNANILAAGLIARLFSIPVVFRLMGVYPVMWDMLERRDLIAKVLRWCYRTPFAAIIATQDGSGVEKWARRACGPDVPVHSLINGVDVPEGTDFDPAIFPERSTGRTTILFIGHLEPLKGCLEFIQAFLQARNEAPDELHAILVGRGHLRPQLDSLVSEAGAGDEVTFIDQLPHEQMASMHKRADIYVSLNKQGNLSNVNLEALKFGQCMILPEPSGDRALDAAAQYVIPPDAARWINSADNVTQLAAAILQLHGSAELRAGLRSAAARAGEALPSWSDRIRHEVSILESLDGRETAA